MKWITRERPKIDRIACPWLIKNFVDKAAVFIYVPADQVRQKAEELDAIPFDVPDVEYSHDGEFCTFDFILQKHELTDPALLQMAVIVRGADTDRFHLAPQAAGLWAISAGLSYNFRDDHKMLEMGMVIYDALYSWTQFLQQEKHTESPVEQLLLHMVNKFITEKSGSKKRVPGWAKELKGIIQDYIDTNFSLNLQEISKELDIHPAYLSRAFSKYFDNLSFGEYIRKMRIEKAIDLIKQDQYSLTEVAYLTGFSDQSHFNRIFKKHTGVQPSAYRKNLEKGKKDTTD
ncbi:MAG TPA: chromate resistance protein [Saprospiraceae bacterium]|nr:chromate resistance protein [Saprospiraceae bacterium]HOY07175.1 chromate resistance protein [Saprospiraceae bacterium]HPI07858.1 chromate resistance protein [Saprospiraceae bacterium]